MDEQLRSNLTSSKHWVRFLYMILFAFFLYIASFLMIVLVVVQFAFALLSGSENGKLRVLGHELTLYIHQTLLFLTYNSDYKPFPFADWPSAPVGVETQTVTVREPGTTSSSTGQPASGGVSASSATMHKSSAVASAPSSTAVDTAGTSVETPADESGGLAATEVRADKADPGSTRPGTDTFVNASPPPYVEPVDYDEVLEGDERFDAADVIEEDELVRRDETSGGDAIPQPGVDEDKPSTSKGGRNRRT